MEHIKNKRVVLCAGGTGGHLFPAQALSEELIRRGHEVILVTDERVRDYGRSFPAAATHIVPSSTLSFSQPLKVPRNAWTLWRGYRAARALLKELDPAVVVGFGGYPSLPPLFAATRLGIATCIHDQNAVMGLANRLLAKRVSAIATSFPNIDLLPQGTASKVTLTGNPVRDVVLGLKDVPYDTPTAHGPFRLTVFGGSQGARFFAEFMPKMLAMLNPAVRSRLHITQQCRPEDRAALDAATADLDCHMEHQSFFPDLPARIAGSHLVFSRSGASTIAELAVIGRPAMMVPLPGAIDNDQLKNAQSFGRAGAGWVMEQAGLTPRGIADFLTGLMAAPDRLKHAADAAHAQGRPDAAARLADLVSTLPKSPGKGPV